MSVFPMIVIALFVIWLLKLTSSSSPKPPVAADYEYQAEPRGIDCFNGTENQTGNFITVLRKPPDVGANGLVTDSMAHTFAHILMGVLPKQELQDHDRAPFDVQLSYALLPGRRQVYKIEVLPDHFQREVSGILEPMFQRLPALPLEGGSLFLACRFRVDRRSPGSPVFPLPFAGLIDADSSLSWETQLEQALAEKAAAADD